MPWIDLLGDPRDNHGVIDYREFPFQPIIGRDSSARDAASVRRRKLREWQGTTGNRRWSERADASVRPTSGIKAQLQVQVLPVE